jgi:DNA-binding response OmpR family regulator
MVRARIFTTSRNRAWIPPQAIAHSIPPRVLVVDDYIDSADALAAFLDVAGFDCRVAYNGCDALKTANEWHPDCIVLDIVMPGLSGLAVARTLRESATTASVSLLAYTAYETDNDYEDLRRGGLDAVCSKPADPVEVMKLLSALLGTSTPSRSSFLQ